MTITVICRCVRDKQLHPRLVKLVEGSALRVTVQPNALIADGAALAVVQKELMARACDQAVRKARR